jgi:ABC-type transporter Mla subunit MlaD
MLDSVRGVMRSAIGAAEHVGTDVEAHSPGQVEAKLDEVIVALHRAADSAERHVEVVENLADTLAPLTDSVARLTDQINLLLQVTAPLAAMERDVSKVRDITRVGGLIDVVRWRRRGAVPPRAPGARPPGVPPRAPGGPGV